MGIEPTNKGFADLCLTTWLPRQDTRRPLPYHLATAPRHQKQVAPQPVSSLKPVGKPPPGKWSGRRGSNPRHRPWQGRTLPAELLPLATTLILGVPLSGCQQSLGGLPRTLGRPLFSPRARQSARHARQYEARAARRAEAYFCGSSVARSYLDAAEISSDFRSASDRESTLRTTGKRNECNGGLIACFDRLVVRNAD